MNIRVHGGKSHMNHMSAMRLKDQNVLSVRKDRVSLTRKVEEKLKELIKERTFIRGSQLPAETELCSMLGVSRTTLRECIRSLEDQRIVVRKQGKGTFIRTVDKAQLNDLLEARYMIECFAAGTLKRSTVTAHEFERWKEAAHHFKQVSDERELAIDQVNFHLLLVQMTHNNQIIRYYTDLLQNLDLLKFFAYDVFKRRDTICTEHLELFRAATGGRIDQFEILLKRHIDSAKRLLFERITSSDENIIL